MLGHLIDYADAAQLLQACSRRQRVAHVNKRQPGELSHCWALRPGWLVLGLPSSASLEALAWVSDQ
jgi:hypothetical protein